MDRETAAIARQFARRVQKKWGAERVILFGSRARGDHFLTSDFDFVVVSRRFAGVPFLERLAAMYDHWDARVDIEALCYTPEEFRRKVAQRGIIRQAAKEGIVLVGS